MSDYFIIKTEILKNNKTVGKWENPTKHLNNYEINHVINLLYSDNISEYGNGIYAKVSAVLREKFGCDLTENAIKKRIQKFKNNKGSV